MNVGTRTSCTRAYRIGSGSRSTMRVRSTTIRGGLPGHARPGLDELDPVAARVLDEGDLRRAVLHRPGLADNSSTLHPELLAATVDVVDAERDVPEAGAELVAVRVPVVRQLEDRLFVLAA